ncbi:SDR family oxidoreductase [Rhizobium sp. L1K21]|uniref:SDR family oxidoreductase n=1 Tax=Rhizobium sp. L1K21 TaxID=2954933 RepID=UPI002092EB8C|nr:SDR family NAD(P)-dependent oxidoreductase [Rhizobium sp. L1K21]MCO6186248.1 SDR family NAD(P)-dependent oxidoreductase [Rhizobium sp. L1K21]
MRFEGRKVLVTGGSAGIGRALTAELVSAGANVVISGRNRARLDAVCAEHPGRVSAIVADFANPQDVTALCRRIRDEHSDISVVINNAGIQEQIDFFSTDPDTIAQTARIETEVNFNAVVDICAAMIPLLRQEPQAAIVNISSALGLVPKKSAPVYCANKAGLRAFTKALRYQAEDAGTTIQVTDVIMALVETGMTAGRGKGKLTPDAAAKEVIRGLIRGREEIWVGKTRLLKAIYRISPALAESMLRNG